MKSKLDEGTVKGIYKTLLERFGEPIGKVKDLGPGVADERGGRAHKGKKVDNCGWGAALDEDLTPGEVNSPTCQGCGAMMPMESDTCNQCGMMAPMDESENGGRHPGHAGSCTCPDCSRPGHGEDRSLDEEDLDQKAPPGREKQVKALKKAKGVKNPWATAWASYNKRK